MICKEGLLDWQDEGDKLIVVERGELIMVFNFHPVNSFSDYRIGCPHAGNLKVWPTLPALLAQGAVMTGRQAVHGLLECAQLMQARQPVLARVLDVRSQLCILPPLE